MTAILAIVSIILVTFSMFENWPAALPPDADKQVKLDRIWHVVNLWLYFLAHVFVVVTILVLFSMAYPEFQSWK